MQSPVIYTHERLLIAMCIRPEKTNAYYADVLDTTPERIELGKQEIKSLGYVSPIFNMPHPVKYELTESGETIMKEAREEETPERAQDYAIVLMGIRYADKAQRSTTLGNAYKELEDVKDALEIAHKRIDKLQAEKAELETALSLTETLRENAVKEREKTADALNRYLVVLKDRESRLDKAINDKHTLFSRAEHAERDLEDTKQALDRKQKELSLYMEKHPRQEKERAQDLNAILEAVKMLLTSLIQSKVSHGEKNATMRELVRMINTEQDNANAYRVPF